MALFTSQKSGTPTVGLELWIDLGLIPTGYDEWIGNVQYASNSKVSTFELRTNAATKATGTVANTTLLDAWTSSSKVKTITKDLYKSGTLHIKTVVSSGVEHWWLRIYSKSSTAVACSYLINYVQE